MKTLIHLITPFLFTIFISGLAYAGAGPVKDPAGVAPVELACQPHDAVRQQLAG
jgi:hypothetical protein